MNKTGAFARSPRCASLVAAAAALALGAQAQATPITWSGSQGSLAASATFDTSGGDLVVTLTNTSSADVLVPADVLTAVLFDVSGSALLLTPVSAVVPPTSTVLFGGTEPGGGVGGEFAYRAGLSGAPNGRAYGISSSGLGLFGPGDLFPGVNLDGPVNPDGLQYGITSAGDNPATGNAHVTSGDGPLIQNQVVLHLSGLPAGFNPAARITGVTFQYGTATTEPNFPGIPEPASCALLALGGAMCFRRRR